MHCGVSCHFQGTTCVPTPRAAGPRHVRLVARSTSTARGDQATSPSHHLHTNTTTNITTTATSTSTTCTGASRCPFLSSLPPPPPAQSAWFNRVEMLLKPLKFQTEALGPHDVVALPDQMGFPAVYVVGDGRLAKAVLTGEGGITAQANTFIPAFADLTGEQNVLLVQEPRHKYIRGLIMQSLSPEAVERLLPRAVSIISGYLDAWAASPVPVKAADELRQLTFDFIAASILGRDYPPAELSSLKSLYRTWAEGLTGWPFWNLPFTTFGRAMSAREKLMVKFQAAIDDMRGQVDAGLPVSGILGSLVTAVDEEGNRLTDLEIRDNLMLLVLAGHDTTSSTLTNMMALLQDNPRVWDKVRAEQQQLLANHGPEVTGTCLKDMVYAEAVIKETLRVRNVVSSVTRVAAHDFELGPFRVPAGMQLYIPLSLLAMRDPRFTAYTPDEFRPERMLTPEGMKPGWQMPFGHGARFCAGYGVAMAEMRVFLALLARSYDFSCDTNTAWISRVGPTPVNGLPLTLTHSPLAV